MSQAVARAERGAGPPSVLLLDLDEFKTINDGLGHGAGDLLLVEVARRLTAVVRDTDTVARLGGDEFAILLPDIDEDQALRIAERALAELQEPFAVGDRAVWTGGQHRRLLRHPGQTADLLLRDADTAMYAAKASGRGNVAGVPAGDAPCARARLSPPNWAAIERISCGCVPADRRPAPGAVGAEA